MDAVRELLSVKLSACVSDGDSDNVSDGEVESVGDRVIVGLTVSVGLNESVGDALLVGDRVGVGCSETVCDGVPERLRSSVKDALTDFVAEASLLIELDGVADMVMETV